MERFDPEEYLKKLNIRKPTEEEIQKQKEKEEAEINSKKVASYSNFYQNFRMFACVESRKLEDLKRENKETYEMMKNWNLEMNFGFCFAGPVGSGKTHAMLAMMNHIVYLLVENGKDPSTDIYWSSTSLLVDQMREAVGSDNQSVMELVKKIQRKPFMFLDDFGSQKSTDFGTEKLMNILDHRVNMNLPTFFTTNCNVKELKETFGERLFSRIANLSVVVEIQGKDRRLQIHNERLKQLKGVK